jgi:hypothetical protein
MSDHVPSPADAAPQQSAEDFLAEIAAEGGRIFRMIEGPRVFMLTRNEQLAGKILRRGGRTFMPSHLRPEHLKAPLGAYDRAPGLWEYDIEIAGIRGVEGDLWEAAGAYRHGVRA